MLSGIPMLCGRTFALKQSYVLSLKQARFTETFFWLAASVVSN